MSTHCTEKANSIFFSPEHMVLLDLERGKNNKRHFTFGVKNHERQIFLVKVNGGKMVAFNNAARRDENPELFQYS